MLLTAQINRLTLTSTICPAATPQEEEEGPASPWYATSTDTDLDSLLGSIPEEGESRLQSGAPTPQHLSNPRAQDSWHGCRLSDHQTWTAF